MPATPITTTPPNSPPKTGVRRPGSVAHSSTQAGEERPQAPSGPQEGDPAACLGRGVPAPQRLLFPLLKLERLLLLLLLQPLPQLLHLLPLQFQEPPLLLLQFLSHCLLHGLPGGLWDLLWGSHELWRLPTKGREQEFTVLTPPPFGTRFIELRAITDPQGGPSIRNHTCNSGPPGRQKATHALRDAGSIRSARQAPPWLAKAQQALQTRAHGRDEAPTLAAEEKWTRWP